MKSLTLIIIFILSLLSSCGGGGGGASTNEKDSEKLRFINAVKGESALDIQLGDNINFSALAYGESTGYFEGPEGDKIPLSVSSSERVLPLLSEIEKITAASKQTYILYDEAKKVVLQAVTEKPVAPLAGESSVRFMNFSEEEISVDIYLVFPGQKIKDQTAASSALAFKSVSDYVSFPSGVYDIVYAAAGSKDIIRRANSISFVEGNLYSHILLDQIGPVEGQTSRIYQDSLF